MKDEINSQIPFPQKKKNVKRKTSFCNSKRVKNIFEGVAPVLQQVPALYPLGGL